MPTVLVASAPEDIEENSEITRSTLYLAPFMTQGFNMTQTSGGRASSRFKTPLKNYWVSFYRRQLESSFGTFYNNLYFGKDVTFPFSRSMGVRLRFTRGISNGANGVTVYVGANLGPSTGTNIGGATVTLSNSNQAVRYDLRVKGHPTEGRIQLYADGVLIVDYTGNTENGLVDGHDLMHLANDDGGVVQQTFSAIVVSTSDTRLLVLKPMPISGNGAFQEWDGDYTDIDDGAIDITDYIESNVPGAVSTFTFTKPDIPDGYTVAGVAVSAQASIYGTVATDIIPVYYDGVSVVELPEFDMESVIYRGNFAISELNPATGVRYTPSEYAALEFGFKVPD